MYKYQLPDMRTPIEKIRSEIERDYTILERECALPAALRFSEVLRAVHIGMHPKREYPFIILQSEFIEHLSAQNMLPELFDKALGLFSSVWNYFPHKDLGMSPVEKIREDSKTNTSLEKEIASLHNSQDEDSLLESVFVAADATLVEFSKTVEQVLTRAVHAIGGTAKDVQEIIRIYTDANGRENDVLAYLATRITTFSKKDTNKNAPIDLTELMRALFFCENHITARLPNTHYTSRMFQNIIEQFSDYGEHVFAAQKETPDKIVALIPPHEQLRALVFTHATLDVIAQRVVAHELLTEAAHYALDWRALINVNETIDADPLYSALVVFGAVYKISRTAHPNKPLGTKLTTLQKIVAQEFDDVSRERFEDDMAHAVKILLKECDNPHLLCAYSTQVHEKELKRLETLSPDFALRSPIALDDLSEPSPF